MNSLDDAGTKDWGRGIVGSTEARDNRQRLRCHSGSLDLSRKKWGAVSRF